MGIEQNIRRRCSPELFEAVSTGRRSFDVRIDNEDIQEGDWYTFVEDTEEERTEVRKISYVTKTKDFNEDMKADAERHGLAIVGMLPPKIDSLESVFQGNDLVVAFVVSKLYEAIDVEEAVTLPLMAAPPIDSNSVIEGMRVALWPDGLFSVAMRVVPRQNEDGSIRLNVKDHSTEKVIYVLTQNEGVEQFVRVHEQYLWAGKTVGVDGQSVVPYTENIPEEDDGQLDERVNEAAFGGTEEDDHEG